MLRWVLRDSTGELLGCAEFSNCATQTIRGASGNAHRPTAMSRRAHKQRSNTVLRRDFGATGENSQPKVGATRIFSALSWGKRGRVRCPMSWTRVVPSLVVSEWRFTWQQRSNATREIPRKSAPRSALQLLVRCSLWRRRIGLIDHRREHHDTHRRHHGPSNPRSRWHDCKARNGWYLSCCR